MRQHILTLLPVLLLVACETPQTEPFPPKVADLPLPTYHIQPGDVLDVKFLYSPELNEEETVRLDGGVSLQYAPDLSLVGKTLDQARHEVFDAYSHTLRDASLELSVKGPLQLKVYVVGEVTTPGEFISQGPPLTLTQVVARAGGVKETADWDNVVLLRRDGNVEHAYSLSFTDAVDHLSPTADVQLVDHDVVYVPRTGVAEAGVLWRQYVMQFVPPNVSYVFGSSGAIIP